MATESETETESGIQSDNENENGIQSENDSFFKCDDSNNSLEDQRSTRSNSFPPNVEINEQTKYLKKKRGRPKKNASITENNDDCGKHIHTSYSSDNIKKKLFRYFVKNFLLPHVNKCMNDGFEMRPPKPIFSVNKYFKLTLREYFSFDISERFTSYDPRQNFYNLEHVTIPSILDMKLLYIFKEGFIKGNNNIFNTQGSNDVICKTYFNYKDKEQFDENYLENLERVVNRLLKPKKIFKIVKIVKKQLIIYLD